MNEQNMTKRQLREVIVTNVMYTTDTERGSLMTELSSIKHVHLEI